MKFLVTLFSRLFLPWVNLTQQSFLPRHFIWFFGLLLVFHINCSISSLYLFFLLRSFWYIQSCNGVSSLPLWWNVLISLKYQNSNCMVLHEILKCINEWQMNFVCRFCNPVAFERRLKLTSWTPVLALVSSCCLD